MKPLSPDVHSALAKWVKKGGTLLVCDDDADPYNKVRDWWNTGKNNYTNPRQHLFEKLGVSLQPGTNTASIEKAGKGAVLWLSADPAKLLVSQTDAGAG